MSDTGAFQIKKEPKSTCHTSLKSDKRQILVNFGLGRKKIFLLDGQNTLEHQFKSYASLDPAFSQLLKECFLVFQEFNTRFGTWVDVDNEGTLSDGTVVRAVFFPKKIEVDDANPGSLKRKKRHTDSVLYSDQDSDCPCVELAGAKKIQTITLVESPQREEIENAPLKSEINDSCQQSSENNEHSSTKKTEQTCNEDNAPCLQEEKNYRESEISSSVTKSSYPAIESLTTSQHSLHRMRYATDNLLQDPGTESVNSNVINLTCAPKPSPTYQAKVGSVTNNILQSQGTNSTYSNTYPPASFSQSSSYPKVPASNVQQVPYTNTTYSNENPVTRVPQPSCSARGENLANMSQRPWNNSRYSDLKCLTPPYYSSSFSHHANVPSHAQPLPYVPLEHHIPLINQPMQNKTQVRQSTSGRERPLVGSDNLQAVTTVSSLPYPVRDRNVWMPQHENAVTSVSALLLNEFCHASTSQSWCAENGMNNSSTRLGSANDQVTSSSRHLTSRANLVVEKDTSSERRIVSSKPKVIDFAEWYRKYKVNHSLKNRTQRMQWGKNVAHRAKSWKGFLFSDVSTFVLKGSHIKRIPSDQSTADFLQSTIEMFWGCITYQGPEIIAPIGNTFESEMLSALLKDEVCPFVRQRFPNIITKLQYYICFSTQYKRSVIAEILQRNSMELDQWPNSLNDINPLEHIWDLIAEKVKNIECSSKERMISIICDIWEKDRDIKLMCREFILSMQSIINDMIAQGGKSPKLTITWS